MHKPTPTIVALAALTLALIAPPNDALAQGGSSAGPPPVTVRVDTARRQPVRELRLVTGQIEAAKRSVVAAEESGRVVVSPPPPGTVLKAGEEITRLDDALLKIDAEAAEATVKEAEAQVVEREAEVSTVQRDLDRLRELLKSGSAREKEVDDADDAAAVARARLALSRAITIRQKAALARLRERLDKTRILAPFDGTIVRKATELGQWTDAGDPVVEMIATDRLRIRLNVPEQMVGQIPHDETLHVRIDALDVIRDVKLFAVVPDGDTQSRTFSALIYLDNTDGSAKAGMSVTANLPTGKVFDAVTVPRDAVVITPTGPVVYAARGGVAVPVSVVVRFAADDRFVIDGALRDGDQVVTVGNERLTPGAKLNIPATPADAPAKPPAPERAATNP